MSIATRTGDSGTTALMFQRRVPKNHPRVIAGGAVDELSAVLGLARASAKDVALAAVIFAEQKCLVGLMAELATDDADRPRLLESKLQRLLPEDLARVDALVAKLESQQSPAHTWDTPGENLAHAHLHLARAVCRRAERDCVTLRATGAIVPDLVLQYLNRLSDALWLLAVDTKS
jgi:cob(I)alamin adenosyltransferase